MHEPLLLVMLLPKNYPPHVTMGTVSSDNMTLSALVQVKVVSQIILDLHRDNAPERV